MLLQGKSAVVTGSTSGIGLGMARALAEQGADILLNGFGPAAEIADLQKCLAKAYGVRVSYSNADMSKAAEITTMVDRAMQEFGRVDILVNNAGIQFTASVHEFPAERWDAIISINLSAVFHSTKAVLPQMLDRNWGRIINIASTARPGGINPKVGLRGRQAWCGRPDQGRGARDGANGRHVQCHLPRLGADASCAEANRRSGEVRKYSG